MKCEEAQELITGLVDNELSTRESMLVTAHFADCAECPKYYSREYALKVLLRNAAMTVRAPTELRARIIRAQRRSQRKLWFSRPWRPLPRAPSLALQAAVLATLLAVPFVFVRYWLTSSNLPIVAGAFQVYRQIIDDEIIPAKMENLAELKQRLLKLVDGEFAPKAYDFSTMNIQLVGGLIQEIANRKVLVAVYQGNGSTILCYTFLGSESDAPKNAEVYFDAGKKMNFYQFNFARTNAVMHRSRNIICVLMAQSPMPDLLELARAKAHSS